MSILFPTAASCSGKVEFGGGEEEAVVAGGGGGGGPVVPPSPQSDGGGGGGGGGDTDAGDIQGDNVVLEDEVVKYELEFEFYTGSCKNKCLTTQGQLYIICSP